MLEQWALCEQVLQCDRLVRDHVVAHRENAQIRKLWQRFDALHVIVVDDERVQVRKLFKQLQVSILKAILNEGRLGYVLNLVVTDIQLLHILARFAFDSRHEFFALFE